jgi:hypothetical protein
MQRLSSFGEAIEFMENSNWKFFTVGNGKKPYHFWVCGSNCYYLFRCLENGHAGAKRQINNNVNITIYGNVA